MNLLLNHKWLSVSIFFSIFSLFISYPYLSCVCSGNNDAEEETYEERAHVLILLTARDHTPRRLVHHTPSRLGHHSKRSALVRLLVLALVPIPSAGNTRGTGHTGSTFNTVNTGNTGYIGNTANTANTANTCNTGPISFKSGHITFFGRRGAPFGPGNLFYVITRDVRTYGHIIGHVIYTPIERA